jgi:DNA-binding transcriptional LysR family regulator
LNDLNTACFLSAARTNNFSATAKELSITQQAVSRSIRKMEEELGFPLFIRNSQTMQLSKGGEYYYRWLTSLDESLSWANAHFSNNTGATPNRFRIAFCNWIGEIAPIVDAADQLRAQNPGLSVEYLTGSADEAFGFVEKGTADLVILPESVAFYITGYPDSYISAPFTSVRLRFHISEEFLLPDGTLDRAAVQRLPLILAPLGGQLDDTISRAAAQFLSLSGAPEVLRVPNFDSAYAEVLCGRGYTISPINPAISQLNGLHGEPLDSEIAIVAMWLQNQRVPLAPVFVELLARGGAAQ